MSRGTGTAGRSAGAIIKAALVCLAAALFVIVEKPADSYISARIVAAAAGVLCAIVSCLRTLRGGTVKAVRGRGSRALLLAGAVLFALVSPLGDYRAYWHQGAGGFLKMALCAVTGFFAAFINTLLFMGSLVLLFRHTEFMRGSMARMGIQSMAGWGALTYIVASVGVNGVVEMIVSTILTGAIGAALFKAGLIHKN